LEGEIVIPPKVKFPVYLRLSLIPSDMDLPENPFFLHPNLLHINMKLNKKNRKLNVSDFDRCAERKYGIVVKVAVFVPKMGVTIVHKQ
jgi:hypothetical protein